MHAVLSIKPRYVEQILAGTKKVEFRKAAFKRQVSNVYIYSSAPQMRIVGYFTIKEIVSDKPTALWDKFNQVGGIDKLSFFSYYQSSVEGYTLCIDKVVTFANPIDPVAAIPGFVPPQSFRYLENALEIEV